MNDAALPSEAVRLLDVATRIDRLERMKRLEALNGPDRAQAARDAARDFEAMFANQMLQGMFHGVGEDALFGGGHAAEIWKDFLIEQYAEAIAEREAFGVADMIYEGALSAYAQTANGAVE